MGQFFMFVTIKIRKDKTSPIWIKIHIDKNKLETGFKALALLYLAINLEILLSFFKIITSICFILMLLGTILINENRVIVNILSFFRC